jgi:hypothetical protein
MKSNFIVGFTFFFINWYSTSALTTPEPKPMYQLPSVSELSDVQYTDWAYEALRSLVEKYGCISGYSDRTYRGERSLTRYEFAAGLNSCLQKIEVLMTSGVSIAKEDVTKLQRLSKDFASELTTLQGRVDGLEGRVAVLENNQFSTTTKLSGEVIFAVSSAFGESVDENVVLSDRVRLFFNTSFTGKDSLGLEIEAGNTPNLREATGTNMARLGFDQGSDNDFAVSFLAYQFPVGESADAAVILNANIFDFVDVINPDVGSDRNGGISRFGVRSPIYRLVNGGSGASFSYDFGELANLTLMYLSSDAPDPSLGLFGGSYAALGQLTLTPSDSVGIGLTYAHSYNAVSSGTGSNNANEPFGDASDAVTANHYGVQATWAITPGVRVSGWGGFTSAIAQDLAGKPDAEIFHYSVNLAFPDLGGEGNLFGLVFGQPPKVTSNDFGLSDPDTSLHFEAFYRFQVTENIAITPGVFLITNPDRNDDNNNIYVGTIRTLFLF